MISIVIGQILQGSAKFRRSQRRLFEAVYLFWWTSRKVQMAPSHRSMGMVACRSVAIKENTKSRVHQRKGTYRFDSLFPDPPLPYDCMAPLVRSFRVANLHHSSPR